MNSALLDRYQLADNFEQQAANFDFPAGVWNVAAELAEVREATSSSELEKLTGQSSAQVREALERLLAKKLVRQNLISWKEFIAAREKARSAVKTAATAPAATAPAATAPAATAPAATAPAATAPAATAPAATAPAATAPAATAPAATAPAATAPAAIASATPAANGSSPSAVVKVADIANPPSAAAKTVTNGNPSIAAFKVAEIANPPSAVARTVANGNPSIAPVKVVPVAAMPPIKQFVPTPVAAVKPVQAQVTVSKESNVPDGHLAQEGVTIRLGTISPPKPTVSSTNGWVWKKPEAAKVAASMSVIPAALPNGEKPNGRLLRPMLEQIENLKGGVEGQLLVYQVFLRVPYQLLHDEGIQALHLVDERTVIKNPVLHAAIVKAAKDVTGVELA